ncbi:MAG: UrcA family protein [Rhodobacterales bacterium]|jgi:UrcA family protein|nr:UrcA family protein [Rhodobacterales bacterium]
MMKQMLAAAALVAVVPFAASAETTTPVTVDITYDHALLASDLGAQAVLSDIRDQARSACTTSGAKFGRSPSVDRDCANDVMAQAAVKILKEREEMGLKTAPAFARVATVETASYEQR